MLRSINGGEWKQEKNFRNDFIKKSTTLKSNSFHPMICMFSRKLRKGSEKR